MLFARKKGYFRETDHDAVMEKVDGNGNIIGFSILKVSALKGSPPLAVTLKKQLRACHRITFSFITRAGLGKRE